jgi:hypothetical protein
MVSSKWWRRPAATAHSAAAPAAILRPFCGETPQPRSGAELTESARFPIIIVVSFSSFHSFPCPHGMSIGEGTDIGFSTARGQDYPTIRQFTVFLENRVGQLLEVVRRFEGSKVRIVALSINDATECAFVRFLLSHPEQGREILERAGLAMIESDLVGIELPKGPQPLLQVCTALLQAEINIVQAYPLIVRPHGKPAVALMVDNLDMAMDTLNSKGFTMISEADLCIED